VTDPVAHLREVVENMLVAEGIEVLDVITLDADPEYGETEWRVGPKLHYLYLSNTFGDALLGENKEHALDVIRRNIAALKERIAPYLESSTPGEVAAEPERPPRDRPQR